VKNLLAFAAMKGGLYSEELTLRREVLRELERLWHAQASATSGSGSSSKIALRDGDALVLHQAINALALVMLRLRKYDELANDVLDAAWMPRIEALLFSGSKGAATSATTTSASAGASFPSSRGTGSSKSSKSSPSAFSTGAAYSRQLAEYLTLVQVRLLAATASSAAAPSNDAQVQQRNKEAMQRLVANLVANMSARPHLQASSEWKLFQGELLLLPPQVHAFVDLTALLPPMPADDIAAPSSSSSPSASSTAGSSDAAGDAVSLCERAVVYFERTHPELSRLPLSESNVRRQWYSPLLHALLQASDAHFQAAGGLGKTKATAAVDSGSGSGRGSAASAAVSTQRALSLLSQALRFVETRVSSDPAHPYLLRTLHSLAVLSHARLGDPIQSEGLLRAVTGRLEHALSGGGPHLHATSDASRFLAYVDALSEQVSLLARLEWNKASRAPEARALLFRSLVPLVQRDPSARQLLHRLDVEAKDTARVVNASLPLGPSAEDRAKLAALRSPDDLTPALAQPTGEPPGKELLPLRPADPSRLPLPEWMADKLQVGSGVSAGR
jgi:hypothetical protein